MGEGSGRRLESVMGDDLYGSRELSGMEWKIAFLVSQGLQNAEIAGLVGMTQNVVKNALRKVFDKVGCWNRTELALWYIQVGVEKERRFNDRRVAETRVIQIDQRKQDRRKPIARLARESKSKKISIDE